MTRCLGFHRWMALHWGLASLLDARECSRCRTFQVYALGQWYSVNRDAFPDVRAA